MHKGKRQTGTPLHYLAKVTPIDFHDRQKWNIYNIHKHVSPNQTPESKDQQDLKNIYTNYISPELLPPLKRGQYLVIFTD